MGDRVYVIVRELNGSSQGDMYPYLYVFKNEEDAIKMAKEMTASDGGKDFSHTVKSTPFFSSYDIDREDCYTDVIWPCYNRKFSQSYK